MVAIEEHLIKSLEISRNADEVLNAAQAELCWGQICKERGDSAAARMHFDSALQLIESGGYEYALAQARRIASAS
jgi:hypothetical protein